MVEEMISVGNCPKCGHFPTQFVAVEGGEDYYIHLPNAPHCDVRSAGDRVQELEDSIAKVDRVIGGGLPDEKQAERVARAFWRRIYPYRNDYEKELPKDCPVEFVANMSTALCALDLPGTEPPWRRAMKRLVFAARTSGSVPDQELMNACAACEALLNDYPEGGA